MGGANPKLCNIEGCLSSLLPKIKTTVDNQRYSKLSFLFLGQKL